MQFREGAGKMARLPTLGQSRWFLQLILAEIGGASERDRTSDLLITNHARCGSNYAMNNILQDYFWGSCPLLVHFALEPFAPASMYLDRTAFLATTSNANRVTGVELKLMSIMALPEFSLSEGASAGYTRRPELPIGEEEHSSGRRSIYQDSQKLLERRAKSRAHFKEPAQVLALLAQYIISEVWPMIRRGIRARISDMIGAPDQSCQLSTEQWSWSPV